MSDIRSQARETWSRYSTHGIRCLILPSTLPESSTLPALFVDRGAGLPSSTILQKCILSRMKVNLNRKFWSGWTFMDHCETPFGLETPQELPKRKFPRPASSISRSTPWGSTPPSSGWFWSRRSDPSAYPCWWRHRATLGKCRSG